MQRASARPGALRSRCFAIGCIREAGTRKTEERLHQQVAADQSKTLRSEQVQIERRHHQRNRARQQPAGKIDREGGIEG